MADLWLVPVRRTARRLPDGWHYRGFVINRKPVMGTKFVALRDETPATKLEAHTFADCKGRVDAYWLGRSIDHV